MPNSCLIFREDSVCPSGSDPRTNLRRSLHLVTWGWVFGAAWQAITTGTPLTVFAQALHASPFQFGVLAALPFLASLVSLPASLYIDGAGRRKGVFLGGLYLQRFMWFPIALVPLWMIHRHPSAAVESAMIVFLGLSLIMHCGQGVGGPAWVSWMSDIVPGRLRGKYFSRRRQWAMITAIPAAVIAGVLLDRAAHDSPIAQLNLCAILFMAAAILGIADISLFLFLGERPRPRQKGATLWRSFARPLANKPFLVFSLFAGALTFALNLTGQFASLYLLDVVHVSNLGAQLMLFVGPLIAQLLVLQVWGVATDRVGIRPVLVLAALGMAPVSLAWCLLTPAHAWLGYVLCAANMALWTGIDVGNFNFVFKFASEDREAGGSYIAVNTVIINIAGCLGGLAAGVIAECLKDWNWQAVSGLRPATFYDVLFVGSAGLRLIAVAIFFPFMHEPSARSLMAALRFIMATSHRGIAGAWGRMIYRNQPRPSARPLGPTTAEPPREMPRAA